jgi:hypothetical protein
MQQVNLEAFQAARKKSTHGMIHHPIHPWPSPHQRPMLHHGICFHRPLPPLPTTRDTRPYLPLPPATPLES